MMPATAVVAIGSTIVISWLALYLAGGTGHVPPHWFYVPILLAGVRFGIVGGVLTALVSGVVTGPLMASDVASGMRQIPSDEIVRAISFVVIGGFMAAIIGRLRRSLSEEAELAHREADLAGRKAAVIATVSHEFRSPITVIGGMAHTLQTQKMVTPEGQEFLNAIGAATRRLTDLVNTVGAVMDGTSGETFVRQESVDLSQMLPTVLVNLGVRDARSRVTLDVAPDARWLVSDPDLLSQLLRHLIENAVRFSPSEQGVEVTVKRSVDRIYIHVLDRGPGIDEAILGRSEPFVQGDQSSTRERGGLGLGLFAASKLAASLGGAVSFRVRPGGGTDALIEISGPSPQVDDRNWQGRSHGAEPKAS
jgi:signal transduction histidine kinase